MEIGDIGGNGDLVRRNLAEKVQKEEIGNATALSPILTENHVLEIQNRRINAAQPRSARISGLKINVRKKRKNARAAKKFGTIVKSNVKHMCAKALETMVRFYNIQCPFWRQIIQLFRIIVKIIAFHKQ